MRLGRLHLSFNFSLRLSTRTAIEPRCPFGVPRRRIVCICSAVSEINTRHTNKDAINLVQSTKSRRHGKTIFIYRNECPLWVRSGHSTETEPASALGHLRTLVGTGWNVRLVPIADVPEVGPQRPFGHRQAVFPITERWNPTRVQCGIAGRLPPTRAVLPCACSKVVLDHQCA